MRKLRYALENISGGCFLVGFIGLLIFGLRSSDASFPKCAIQFFLCLGFLIVMSPIILFAVALNRPGRHAINPPAS